MELENDEYQDVLKRISNAVELFLKGDKVSFNKSIIIHNEISESYPNIGLVQNNLATSLNKIGEYELAIKYYQIAINCGLNNSNVYTSIGVCYENLKKYKLAIENFNMAISLDNLNGKAYFLRARCFKNIGWIEEYNRDNRKAVELNFYG